MRALPASNMAAQALRQTHSRTVFCSKSLPLRPTSLFPETSLKWDRTEPRPGEFNFAEGDSIAAFATRNDMLVHGHTLVWYAAIPAHGSLRLQPVQEAKAALERHITTQVSRYRGKIWAWDVINEAIEPEDRLDDGYRNSVWFRSLGADYIDLAFRLARARRSLQHRCA